MQEDGDASGSAPRPRVSPIMRLLVLGFGVLLLLTARSVIAVGGVAIAVGVIMVLVALAILVIASGFVEWWVRRPR